MTLDELKEFGFEKAESTDDELVSIIIEEPIYLTVKDDHSVLLADNCRCLYIGDLEDFSPEKLSAFIKAFKELYE